MKRRTLLKSISALFLPLWANGTIAQETDHPIIKFCEDNNMLRSYLGYPNMTDPKPEFYPIQRKILNNIMKYDKSHIMACRQIGMSTMSNCVLAYTAMTKPNSKCLLASHSWDRTKFIKKQILDILPNDLLTEFTQAYQKTNVLNTIFLKNGSEITVASFDTMHLYDQVAQFYKVRKPRIYDVVIVDNPDIWSKEQFEYYLSSLITHSDKRIICGTPFSKKGYMHSFYDPSNPAHMKVTWKDMPQRRLSNLNRLKQVFIPEEWETEFECNPSV
jgi:hypothetical protein